MKKTNEFENLTRRQMAKILGKSERTLGNWLQDGCPRKKNGKYSAPEVIGWLMDRESAAMGAGAVDSPALERYRLARAEMAELDLQERSEKLVPYDEVIRGWCARQRMVRDSFLTWSNRLPPLLAGLDHLEIARALKSEVYSILTAFAKDGRWTPPVDETCIDDPAKCDQRCQKEDTHG